MKKTLTILFLIIVSISLAQQDHAIWKSELDFDNGIIFDTFLNVEISQDQYILTSPKNADVRMLGSLKARLGRFFGKIPKKGIFISINTIKKGDSLFGNTKLPVFGNLKFKGILTENLLSGEFVKNDTIIMGTITGVKSKENSINYSYLHPKILEITHDNIYSKDVLQTKKWKKFQKKLENLCNNAQDDIELFLGFNILSSELPFSHYNLFVNTMEEENETEILEKIEPSVVFEEENSNTAYLKIKNFSTSQKELADILPKIVEKNYQNLIVDLRDNGGGGIDPAFEFAKHITNKTIEVGYFVTNKLEFNNFDAKLFEELPKIKPQTNKEFFETLKAERGAKLIFDRPDNPIFSGNIYILTNKNTGSTCEPLVYALKNYKMATVVGEKTAGAMLSATYLQIFGKYLLKLPIADFYTYDGVRIEGIGVTPNIETASEDALDKALSLINEQ